MAAPVQNFDPFGNDALFEEFEKPVKSEDWDQEMSIEESRIKGTVSTNSQTGAKHTTFHDSSDSSDDEESSAEPLKTVSNGVLDPSKRQMELPDNCPSGQQLDHLLSVDQSCCVQVSFINKKFALRHKDEIQNFISGLIADDDDDIQFSSTHENRNVECLQFYTNFMIDHRGRKSEPVELSVDDHRPLYAQVFRRSLPCDSESEDDEDACPQSRPTMKKSCWNCDGAHSLNECTLPRDHNKIAMNRAAFIAAKENTSQSLTDTPKAGDSRYLAVDDPRFANLKPGHVSESLREALGIQSDELPPYIYNMRNHGYPPGHLLDAKLSMGDIAMFDKHGQEVGKDGQVMEDGEVDENASKGGYNYNKIIEYPGFNVFPGSGTQDCQNPPFNEFQLKSNLPRIFGTDTFRKTDGLERDKKSDLIDREEEDMDLAVDGSPNKSFRPVLSENSGGPSSSASLSDLESTKAQILASLSCESTESTEDETNNTDSKMTESETTDTEASNSLCTPKYARSKSVLINMGTPIGVNSAQVLPDSDKFRENITEHIPYENLPNATGMFDKMMKVMGKVKDALSNMRK